MQGLLGRWRLGLVVLIAGGAAAQDAADVVWRARELQQKGDRVGALALLDAEIRPATTNAALWLLRAEVRRQTGALDDALGDSNRGVALLVRDRGLSILVEQAEGARNGIAAGWCCRGMVRGKLGDWRGAAKDFTDATTLMPREARRWRDRAVAEWNLGRHDDAVASLGRAIEIGDDLQVPTYVLRSFVHQLAGRDADARADLERAAELAAGTPALVDVNFKLAVLATSVNDATAACSACDLVWAASPELAGWVALLRWSNAGPREHEDATKRLREDFAAKPANDPLVAELFRLCADGVGDTDDMALAGRDSAARCPMWYYGACRAAQLGRDADARVRFLRCVNTGRWDSAQWRLALARLRALAEKQELQPALGATVAAVADAKTPTLVVTELVTDGAAVIQGLQRGDQIVRVADQPATVAAFVALTKALGIGGSVRFMVARGDATEAFVISIGIAAP